MNENSVIQVQIQTNIHDNWSVNALGLSPKLFIPDNVYFVAVLT